MSVALWLSLALAPAPADPAPRKVLRPTFVDPAGATVDPVQAARDDRARDLGLRRAGGGYIYDGAKGERFKARILRDGTVEFNVEPQVQVKLDGVCLLAICIQTKSGKKAVKHRKRTAAILKGLGAALAEGSRNAMGGGPRWYGQPVSGPIEGSRLPGPPPFNAVAAQGRYGFLPTPLAAMSRFMDRTFDLRFEMALQATRGNFKRASKRLPQTLGALWVDASLSVAQRKARVLNLWDEFDPGAEHIDLALVQSMRGSLDLARHEGALAGRRLIVDAVRRHLPQGSRSAFTDAELDEFNGRPGAGPAFRPYDVVPGVEAEPVITEPAPTIGPKPQPK